MNHFCHIRNHSSQFGIKPPTLFHSSRINDSRVFDGKLLTIEVNPKENFNLVFTCVVVFCQDLVHMHLLIRRSSSSVCYTSVSMCITSKRFFLCLMQLSLKFNLLRRLFVLFCAAEYQIAKTKKRDSFAFFIMYIYNLISIRRLLFLSLSLCSSTWKSPFELRHKNCLR